MSGRGELPLEWLRMWERPGVPTWGIGSDMTIRFLNRRAEEMLGISSAEAKGKPCYDVVKGLDGALAPFCCKDCPIFRASQGGSELEPAPVVTIAPAIVLAGDHPGGPRRETPPVRARVPPRGASVA